jgi:orotidine-5'-phosphate decarboxylase
MTTSFRSRWRGIVKRRGNLFIGADPSLDVSDLQLWLSEYLKEVGKFAGGIKPNPGFYQRRGGMEALEMVPQYCRENDLLSVIDAKVSDIGKTNIAWMENYRRMGYDAVTIAPYAGNIKQTIQAAKEIGIVPIMMGLMSNPEFMCEVHSRLGGEDLWRYRIRQALEAGVECLVLGGTYKRGDKILGEFADVVRDQELVYLMPGFGGDQGGDLNAFAEVMKEKGLDWEDAMPNVGTGIMYPKVGTRGEAAQRMQRVCKENLDQN